MIARTLLVTSLMFAGTAFAAPPPPSSAAPSANPQARKELPYADCLRTDRINEWAVVDNRTLTVRNGPNHFLVKTTVDCPRMSLGGAVHFRASESDKAMSEMRICGGINEQIVRRDDPPCQIQSITTIDKAEFQRLGKQAKLHGNGAAPNGAVP